MKEGQIPRFGDKAFVLDAKITDYILSPSHRIGANKARVFKAALGIEAAHADVLKAALLDAARTQSPMLVRQDEYGRHYAIVFELSYGGKSAFVRSLWIIKTNERRANLVSAFVVSDRRAGLKEIAND